MLFFPLLEFEFNLKEVFFQTELFLKAFTVLPIHFPGFLITITCFKFNEGDSGYLSQFEAYTVKPGVLPILSE